MKSQYDIAIIGGGPAGLTAALTAARGNRSIIIFDNNQPRNAPASKMMNFPSHDGTPPQIFRDAIKKDLTKYPLVEFSQKKIELITRIKDGFSIDGIVAKKILLAHGVKDILLPIPGMRELFGKSIFHCPYCHGHEHLNAPMGIIGAGDFARHFKTLVKSLSSDLMIFTNGQEMEDLSGVKIYREKIKSLIHEEDQLKAVKLVSGEVVERSYLFFKPQQTLSSDIGVKLGCELNEHGLYKVVNEIGLTTQPGVYAAGDITHLRQSVLTACSQGQLAGAGMNYDILHEEELTI